MIRTLVLFALLNVAAFAAEKHPLPAAHTTRNIEGWTVRVDDRLLEGEHAALGERALKLLAARLVAIATVVPEQSLAKLRAITIQLDLDHGDLRSMQYHPDANWLKDHGYTEELEKCVHIPDVEDFLSPSENLRMPWVVLHELAHGFHDQVIGFDDPRVIAAWKKFCDSGKYKSTLTMFGKMHEHYGLTDQKEFFAEMTESYFGSNDFYPFVAGELKQAEPEIFALLADIWGPLPGVPPAEPQASPVEREAHTGNPAVPRHPKNTNAAETAATGGEMFMRSEMVKSLRDHAAPAVASDALAQARTELHKAVDSGQVAGAAHLVVRNGKAVYWEVAGVSDIEDKTPFRRDALVRIYSMTKPIVSVAAMVLYEQGRFQLDDPVAKFIPAFTRTTVLVKDGDTNKVIPANRPITVRDVFRHTTGYSYGDEPDVRSYYEREGLRYQGTAEMFPPNMTIRDAAEALARVPALHHPGERFTYGFNTDLLGRLIEVWSGQPLDAFLKLTVFEPLEMVDTGFSVAPGKRHRLATCHTFRDGKLTIADKAAQSPFNEGFKFLSGGGGLVSTMQDYANFCQMLVQGGQFKGKRLLKKETVKLMFTDQLNGVAGNFRFGLGFEIGEAVLGTGKLQRKVPQYSWGGYASTEFRLVPDEQLFQIFMQQLVPSSPDIANRLFSIVYAGLVGADDPAAGRVPAAPGCPANWSQFRGPNGSGVADGCHPPVNIAPDQAAWKTPLPAGKSSPILWGGKVFLTGVEEGRLATMALDATSGKLLWVKHAPQVPLEPVHPANSAASSTPCADESNVYVYFGSYGLLCYDHEGHEEWKKAIPTPKNMYGVATSPIVHEQHLILLLDDDANLPGSTLSRSKLIALDKTTGQTVWETARPFNRGAWSTPMIWYHERGADLVALGDGRVTGYDPATGTEKWYVRGFAREPIAVPVAGNGLLYVSVSMQGGRGDARLDPEPFWKAMLEFDRNGDGRIGRDEITQYFTLPLRPELPPENPGFGLPLPSDSAERKEAQSKIFDWRDKNKDGFWTKEEFVEDMTVGRGQPNLAAISPGGTGDITTSHVRWNLRNGIPEIPSPIYFAGRLYLIRDGGVLSCVNATTGEVVYRERLTATGQYIASPVIANGYMYFISSKGVLTIVKCGDKFEVVHQADLKASVAATPAMDANSLYVRTGDALLAFR